VVHGELRGPGKAFAALAALFEAGDCPGRWRSWGLSWVRTKNEAALLDLCVLSPLLVAAGVVGKPLPRLVRYGLVAAGMTLAMWNAVELVGRKDESGRDSGADDPYCVFV
jgi:hypothetical protein